MAMGRPGIQYSAKVIMGGAANPTRLTMARFRRFARYAAANPVLERRFPLQCEKELTLEACADSDWGGDEATRRSTTCVVARFGA
eukprot:5702623-Lingulodinium_polyedra.AAC.1